MLPINVGPLAKAGDFAVNLYYALTFNAAVPALIQFIEEVELGLTDPDLPESVKQQVHVDYNEIRQSFDNMSGSIPVA